MDVTKPWRGRVFTDEALAKAVEVLGRHTSVRDAVAELGCNYDSLKYALRGAGLGNASQHLRRNAALTAAGSKELVLTIPDMHKPYHAKLVWRLILKAVEELKPTIVVIIGDFVDCFEISDFAKTPERRASFAEEIEAGNRGLDELMAACERAGVKRIIYCMGNHENRLERYLSKRAPELYSLLSIEDLLNLDSRGIEVVPYGEDIAIGKVHFSHEFGPCGKYAAQQTLASVGHCAVFGHIHTAQVVYGGFTTGERHVAMAVGWGGDYEALAFSYKRKALAKKEWIHGFGWCEIESDGRGWVTFVPILDGRVRVAGRVIEVSS